MGLSRYLVRPLHLSDRRKNMVGMLLVRRSYKWKNVLGSAAEEAEARS